MEYCADLKKKKKEPCHMLYNMDEPQGRYVRRNKNKVWLHTYEIPKVIKVMVTEKKKVVTKGWEEGRGEISDEWV